MKRWKMALVAGLILPALVCIAQPSRNPDGDGDPAAPPPVSPGGGGGGPHGGGGGAGEHRGKREFNPTKQDIEDTMAFVHDTSPIREAMMPKGWKPTPMMIMRYLEFRRLREEDPELYELRIQEMQKEDTISDLGEKYKQASSDSALKAQLYKAVGEVIQLRIKECDHRIAKLSEQIEKERVAIQQLQSPDAVQKRVEYELSQSNPWIRPGLGGGRRRENSSTPTAGPAPAPTTAPAAIPVAAPTTAPSP